MASTYLLYKEENKIKKSVTDSASFEIGIKIGLRPFSGTKSEAIQVHSNIIDPLKVSLVSLFAYLLLIVASALLKAAEFLHELTFISTIQCLLLL